MAGIKFSKKEFEKHFKLTEELKEKISLFGTHFEGMNEDGSEMELEITPNRPDLYSLQGFIRAFSAFMSKKDEVGLKEYKVNKPEKNFEVKIDKSVSSVRPFTACAIIKNLKFDDEKIKEIIDIQEKIHNTLGRNRKKIAIGIYPLEKIKLPIRFEAKTPKDIKFQPLEMDREINGLQILQQHATGREYAHLLEGNDKFPIFIDANNEILSMPPIINSHKTGKITETTKDIFIECSGFDFEILKKTLNILVTMLAEMGGDIYQMNLVYSDGKKQTPDLTPEKMKLNIDNANKLLGLSLKESEVKTLLERAGYNYDSKKSQVEIPAWRTDIMHEVDIIEDIAIAYGYDNFIPEIPQISTVGQIDSKEELKKKIADLLAGLNLLETSSYHLLSQDDFKKVAVKPIIEVEDSKSEYKYLRASLLGNALNILSKNIDSEYPQKIFELGRVFTLDQEGKEETGIKEEERLSIVLAQSDSNFTLMKQIIEYLMRMLDINFKIESAQAPFFIDGRCASIIVDNKIIGYFGEISPQILSNLRIKMPVVGLELSVDGL